MEKGKKPDYQSADGVVAIWLNKDKNGKMYLSGKINGVIPYTFKAFKNEPREKKIDESLVL